MIHTAARWGGITAVAGAFGYAVPSVPALAIGVGLTATVRRCAPGLTGRGRPDHVSLTFDDGPDGTGTPEILDILGEVGVRATFFVLGEQVAAHPVVTRRLVDEGHEIGLHGWHHRNSLLVSPRALNASLVRAVDRIADSAGVKPRFYRPPYGMATAATVWASRRLGLTTVLWDAWACDWRPEATPDGVVSYVLRNARGGSTVLLHDSDYMGAPGSWRATAGALRPLVQALVDKGLEVGPLRDHIAI